MAIFDLKFLREQLDDFDRGKSEVPKSLLSRRWFVRTLSLSAAAAWALGHTRIALANDAACKAVPGTESNSCSTNTCTASDNCPRVNTCSSSNECHGGGQLSNTCSGANNCTIENTCNRNGSNNCSGQNRCNGNGAGSENKCVTQNICGGLNNCASTTKNSCSQDNNCEGENRCGINLNCQIPTPNHGNDTTEVVADEG